eukprot:479517_1
MSGSVAFSSKAEDAIFFRKVEVHDIEEEDDANLDVIYDIPATVNFIAKGDFRRVALQFPEKLIHNAPDVVWRLEEELQKTIPCLEGVDTTTRQVFITGDTSYGSCCVDEVSAQHLNADCIVHYGHACLSSCASSIPVLYIFGHKDIPDIPDLTSAIADAVMRSTEGPLILLYDVVYMRSLAGVLSALQPEIRTKVLLGLPQAESTSSIINVESNLSPQMELDDSARVTIAGLCLRIEGGEEALSRYSLLFVGGEGRQLSNALMRCAACKGIKQSYDPCRLQKDRLRNESTSVNRELMKRYYLIQKVREASIIGIVVGTMGVSSYNEVVTGLRRVLSDRGRKTYTFAIGKVTPEKLANFAEVQAFCLVACEESAMLDNREFHAPIVTPLEMEIALEMREWGNVYSTSFEDLMLLRKPVTEQMDGSRVVNVKNEDDAARDAPFYSLVSGSYRNQPTAAMAVGGAAAIQLEEEALNPTDNTQAHGDQGGVLSTFVSPAAEFLGSREFRGLEIRKGKTKVHTATEGKTGIASDYKGI